MIRRYLPERSEIRMGMAGELREIVDEADNRPMRVLYYRTPARIQFVSATLVFGLAAFDCSLAISSSHTSLGVL